MLELLNVRFTFSLRTSFRNQEGKSPIILRISYQGERRDVFTGLYCFEKDWSNCEMIKAMIFKIWGVLMFFAISYGLFAVVGTLP